MKPCPQCNGKDIRVLRGFMAGLPHDKRKAKRYCVCYKCGYAGPLARTEGMAITAWDKITRKAK